MSDTPHVCDKFELRTTDNGIAVICAERGCQSPFARISTDGLRFTIVSTHSRSRHLNELSIADLVQILEIMLSLSPDAALQPPPKTENP